MFDLSWPSALVAIVITICITILITSRRNETDKDLVTRECLNCGTKISSHSWYTITQLKCKCNEMKFCTKDLSCQCGGCLDE